MNQSLAKVFSAAALACMSFGAQASVLTFETGYVGASSVETFFTADYEGFRFGDNVKATNDWFYTNQVTPFYTPKSPTHYIATDFRSFTGAPFETAMGITSAVDFKFDGAWFSGEGQIKYELYNNNLLVCASGAPSAALSDTTPIFVASCSTALVDEVRVLGKQGFYAMDDFTYNTGIPEPTSLALVLLAGAVGVGATRRKSAAAPTAA